MEDYIVSKTSVWGDTRGNCVKNSILQCYPFIDHKRLYAYKPQSQRGKAHQSQTFLVSFAYCQGVDSSDNKEFLEHVAYAGLRVCRYRTTFRGSPAYKIIIAATEVNILHALEILGADVEEEAPAHLPFPTWSVLNKHFQNPIITTEEWNRLKIKAPISLGDGIYKCPHCSWVNYHAGGQGHRECDGPLESEWVCVPQADFGWTGIGQSLPGWNMYACPGYTIESI